jgi:hypothetical protein
VYANLAMLGRAQSAETLGRVAEARDAYASFIRGYDLPDPSHRHLVELATRALGELDER